MPNNQQVSGEQPTQPAGISFAPLSLKRNFSWTIFGNAVFSGCQWLITVVLAKLGSKDLLGIYILGIAISMPVLSFANLQLRYVLATDAKRQHRFSDYLGLSLLTTILGLLLIPLICLLFGHRGEVIAVVCAVALARAFESISDVLYGWFQLHERLDRVARAMILKGPLAIGTLAVVFWLTRDLLLAVLALALTRLAVLLLYEIPAARAIQKWGAAQAETDKKHPRESLTPRWLWPHLKKLFILSLPLGFVTLMIQLHVNMPRYFVELEFGEGQLGIFGAISQLLMAGQLIVLALGQSASPRLAKLWAEGSRQAFKKLLIKLIGISLLLGVAGLAVALVAGEWLLKVLFKPEYAEHVVVLYWIMGVAAIQCVSMFFGNATTAMRIFKPQTWVHLFRLVVAFLLCYWLVPKLGLVGAALALFISTATGAASYGLLLLHNLKRAATTKPA